MTKSNRDIQSGCFNLAYKSALEHANGPLFSPWHGLNSLAQAASYIRGIDTAVADHQRNSILKLAFEILFTMGHRDLAYWILEALEDDIDRQEGVFIEIAIEDADFICRRLLNMHLTAEANRVASKYIQKIEKRLESSFDPFLDVALLKEVLQRLEHIKVRAKTAACQYEQINLNVEYIIGARHVGDVEAESADTGFGENEPALGELYDEH